jgi:putative peptidoglycan lipid II flippase
MNARPGHAAALVAAGIFLTRLTGFLRQRVFAHYFGLGLEADAFSAAFRIPNVLQNLFGEGALSASFIPVYASRVARGERGEADRVAGAVAALLALVVSAVVLVGVLAAPYLVDVIAPGFEGAGRLLTIQMVRILFPGAGLLVFSAWCLGVLNSHRRFLLSYTAPVMWNAAMIGTLAAFGGRVDLPRLAVLLAWGSVAGSALQFVVQLPAVVRVAPDLRLGLDMAAQVRADVAAVVTNFVPAFFSRGVVQISAYIDTVIASLLPTGAVAGLMNAQMLYTLPISLFGMSVSAAELPELSAVSTGGADPAAEGALRSRLDAGLRRIAFFVVPSAVAFLTLGDVIAATVFQTGRFSYADAVFVWSILAGAAVGLLPQTLGRLYASAYYALRDTRTPLRYALVRVALGTVLGYLLAIRLPPRLDIAPIWGAAGLALAAGIAGWVEMLMLRRTLNQRIGRTGLPADRVMKLWAAAMAGGTVAWGAKAVLPAVHPVLDGLLVLGTYGVTFLLSALALRIPEASRTLDRLLPRRA